jgi:hypothetical protein
MQQQKCFRIIRPKGALHGFEGSPVLLFRVRVLPKRVQGICHSKPARLRRGIIRTQRTLPGGEHGTVLLQRLCASSTGSKHGSQSVPAQ